MSIAGLFPGKGSERENMLELCLPEHINRLNSYRAGRDGDYEQDVFNEQAIFVVSASLWDRHKESNSTKFLAGHSLGYYGALYAAGCIDLDTGLYIIESAYKAIKEVSGQGEYGMTAIIGLKWDIIDGICRKREGLYLANINSATQVVVSGVADALQQLEKDVTEEGALRVVRLPSPYPLHTPLLDGVSDILAGSITFKDIRKPEVAVIDHTTSEVITEQGRIITLLLEQFSRRVVWRGVIDKLWSEGVRRFIEYGPGDVLSRLTRWIVREAEVESLDREYVRVSQVKA